MSLSHRIVDRLAASDPNLARLRMGLRTTLTLVAVAASLAAVHSVYALPVAAYGVGMITAIQGALAIRDAGAKARAVTRLYCALSGFTSIAVTSLMEGSPRLVDGLFLAIIFGAVWLRKFGVRWNAVGMYTFMCTFIGAYLHPALADLGGVALALVLSAAVAHTIRNTILPERPERDFKVAVAAAGARLMALRLALAGIERRRSVDPNAAGEIVALEARVKDAILMAEGNLPIRVPHPADDEQRRDMVVALFDLQLAAESAIFVSFDDSSPSASTGAEHGQSDLDKAAKAGRRIERAWVAVKNAERNLSPSVFKGEMAPPMAATGGGTKGLFGDPALKLAIQVTLASAIAMVGGLWLSETRWFWAILTAFLVFTNTQSRGDTAIRGLARAFGTLFGIVVGIGLATLLAGHFIVSGILIVAFVFTGFYYLQLSYAVLTFFVTLVVSLLYGLLGEFTPALLVLRLEETLIGSAAGIFISFVVFPRSTSAAAGVAVEAFFAAFDDLLTSALANLQSGARGGLIARARVIDKRFDEVSLAARPLGSNWQLVRRPGQVRRTLIRFRGAAHWAHVLAQTMRMRTDDPEQTREIADRLAALRQKLAVSRRNGERFFAREGAFLGRPPSDIVHLPDFVDDRDDPRFAIAVLTHIFDRDAAEEPAAARPSPRRADEPAVASTAGTGR